MTCPLCGQDTGAECYVSYKDLTWLKCGACGFGYLSPYIAEEEQARAQTTTREENPETTYAKYLQNASLFSEVATEKARWISAHIAGLPQTDMAPVIVEIGPGLGSVLKQIRTLRPNQNILAVESQDRFSSHLQGEGFLVLKNVSLLRNHPMLSKKHVVLFMDNVLEHIPRPAQYLNQLRTLLRPNSFSLLIEVPNESGLEVRAKIQDLLRGFPKPPTFPGHINLFTRKTLGLCAQSAGIMAHIRSHPIRSASQIQYLSQRLQVSALARAAVFGLKVLPVDLLLGWSYWLRLEGFDAGSKKAFSASTNS